ncbi:NucA/NucB deoxyribonuclease domain-containing protein [Streptomyces sp. NPDC004008]
MGRPEPSRHHRPEEGRQKDPRRSVLHPAAPNLLRHSAPGTEPRHGARGCQAQWPNYSSQGKDCDEYPFSTTKEGAYNANGNFSARALTSKDNQKAGSQLSTWYNDDRILDGDAFYVNVK